MLLSLALFGPASTLESPPVAQDPAIYGGETVEGDEHTETVYIRIGAFVCTGTLLTPKLVLTAAHCFDGVPDPEDICVMLGATTSAVACWGSSGTATVSHYGAHPDYCAQCDEDAMDIGYLWLNEQVAGIPFPSVITDQGEYDNLVGEDEKVLLVGYGQNESGGSDGKKRFVETKITRFIDSAKEFYAGGKGKDTCLGDSGGPAFARAKDGSLRLVGVTSRGYPECGTGGVYGAPLPAMCWVEERTGTDLLPEDCKSCDCVDLTTASAGCGCRTDQDQGPPLLVGWLAMVVLYRRRRTSARLGTRRAEASLARSI